MENFIYETTETNAVNLCNAIEVELSKIKILVMSEAVLCGLIFKSIVNIGHKLNWNNFF